MIDQHAVNEHIDRIAARAEGREARWAEKRQALVRTAGVLAMAADHGPSPVLVAEGDSWFDYPGLDILDALEGIYRYEIISVAHYGHTLESMAYSEEQLDGLYHAFGKIAKRHLIPKAVLLSGGGNDIAGDEFAILLNHQLSGLEPLNEDVVRGVIDVRLRAAYEALILKVSGMCQRHFGNTKIPVVLHGYAHAVPDGRGFLGGWSFLPGPWLKPGFEQKGYRNLAENTGRTATLIDRFNQMLADLAAEPGFDHVRVVDVRQVLSNELFEDEYQHSWVNELHPKKKGFEQVAEVFAGIIDQRQQH